MVKQSDYDELLTMYEYYCEQWRHQRRIASTLRNDIAALKVHFGHSVVEKIIYENRHALVDDYITVDKAEKIRRQESE